MGSTVYAEKLIKNGEKIKAMYSFDSLGYYSEEEGSQHYPLLFSPFFPNKGNFVSFVGNLNSRDLIKNSILAFRENSYFNSEGISSPTTIPGIDFSDHLSFYKHNIPAVMISDTAFFRSSNYHQTTDTIEYVNVGRMSQLTDELEKMFKKLYFY